MKNLMRSFLLLAFTFLANTALAAEQASAGMMQDSGMMGAGFMLACIVLLILLFIALVLAILSMIKYLFFSKSKKETVHDNLSALEKAIHIDPQRGVDGDRLLGQLAVGAGRRNR